MNSKNFEIYGPVIGGKDLWKSLGYKTFSAFSRAIAKNTIAINVFRIEGRRGWFALTEDLTNWLSRLKEPTQITMKGDIELLKN